MFSKVESVFGFLCTLIQEREAIVSTHEGLFLQIGRSPVVSNQSQYINLSSLAEQNPKNKTHMKLQLYL